MTRRSLLSTLAWFVPGIYLLAIVGAIACVVARVDDELSWIPLAALGLPWSLVVLQSHLYGWIAIVLLAFAAALNPGVLYWFFRRLARSSATRSSAAGLSDPERSSAGSLGSR